MTLLKGSSRGAPILLRQITFRASILPATVFLLLLDAIFLAGLNNYSLRWGVFPQLPRLLKFSANRRLLKKATYVGLYRCISSGYSCKLLLS